jgi:hypothetical protein
VQEVGESSQEVARSNISQNPRMLFATEKSFAQDGEDDGLLLQMGNMKTVALSPPIMSLISYQLVTNNSQDTHF